MRTEAKSTKKKLRIQKYPDMCGRDYIFVNYFSYFKIIINIHYYTLKQKQIIFEPMTKMNISTHITTPTN